ncbi:MAG: redoxin domain-containing protein [Verrucomicrobiaceae bacterium]|nr:redoxin domain-containing protein [Verrucomicrobiaceae bacterium]
MKTGFLSLVTLALFAGMTAAQNEIGLPQLTRPVIVAKSLAGKLVKIKDGELVPHALDPEKAIDHFLLYFSAGWSPGCKKFTPALIKFYRDAKAAGANFEIVFVSRDDSEEEMLQYIGDQKMPWPALRFDALNGLDFVKQAAGRGIPCLAALDSRGLILAHSYKQRKNYIGVETPLMEFARLIGVPELMTPDPGKTKAPDKELQPK